MLSSAANKVNKKIRGITMSLADYVAKASYADLPRDVQIKAKLYILDSIGNMIGGSMIVPGKIILELFQEMGGKPESTVLATGHKIPCVNADVNAALSNMLDFDDTFANWFHPACVIVPPALAVAEKIGASGQALINSVVLGYEISLRVGLATKPTPDRFRQVAGLATPLIFGAVVACAKLMKLTTDQISTAFGHAGFNAPMPMIRKIGLETEERPISWLKNNMGWASAGGLLAALLAEKGFVGNKHVFDGERGFWVISGSDQCDFSKYTEDLGEKYLIVETGFKPYASCRWTHTTLDAIHEILGCSRIKPSEIRKINVRGCSEFVKILSDVEPANIIDAQYSIPAVVALTLAGYTPAKGLSDEHLKDEMVTNLMRIVHVETDPEADEAFNEKREVHSNVTIEMEDGKTFQAEKRIAGWEPNQPPTVEELERKFVNIASPVIGKNRSESVLHMVRDLDSIGNVQMLTGI